MLLLWAKVDMSSRLRSFVRSFVRGIGSVVNIMPVSRPKRIVNPCEGQSVEDALRGDWERLGDDMEVAIAKVTAADEKSCALKALTGALESKVKPCQES